MQTSSPPTPSKMAAVYCFGEGWWLRRPSPLPRSRLLDAKSVARYDIEFRVLTTRPCDQAPASHLSALPSSLAIAFPLPPGACNLPSAASLLRFSQLSQASATLPPCVPSRASSPQTWQGADCELNTGCHCLFLLCFKWFLFCIWWVGVLCT